MIPQAPVPGTPQIPAFPMIELPAVMKPIADLFVWPVELTKYITDMFFDTTIHAMKWEIEPVMTHLTSMMGLPLGMVKGPSAPSGYGGISRYRR